MDIMGMTWERAEIIVILKSRQIKFLIWMRMRFKLVTAALKRDADMKFNWLILEKFFFEVNSYGFYSWCHEIVKFL